MTFPKTRQATHTHAGVTHTEVWQAVTVQSKSDWFSELSGDSAQSIRDSVRQLKTWWIHHTSWLTVFQLPSAGLQHRIKQKLCLSCAKFISLSWGKYFPVLWGHSWCFAPVEQQSASAHLQLWTVHKCAWENYFSVGCFLTYCLLEQLLHLSRANLREHVFRISS